MYVSLPPIPFLDDVLIAFPKREWVCETFGPMSMDPSTFSNNVFPLVLFLLSVLFSLCSNIAINRILRGPLLEFAVAQAVPSSATGCRL